MCFLARISIPQVKPTSANDLEFAWAKNCDVHEPSLPYVKIDVEATIKYFD